MGVKTSIDNGFGKTFLVVVVFQEKIFGVKLCCCGYHSLKLNTPHNNGFHGGAVGEPSEGEVTSMQYATRGDQRKRSLFVLAGVEGARARGGERGTVGRLSNKKLKTHLCFSQF